MATKSGNTAIDDHGLLTALAESLYFSTSLVLRKLLSQLIQNHHYASDQRACYLSADAATSKAQQPNPFSPAQMQEPTQPLTEQIFTEQVFTEQAFTEQKIFRRDTCILVAKHTQSKPVYQLLNQYLARCEQLVICAKSLQY